MAADNLFPFDFYVAATPLSLQAMAGSRQRWKERLQALGRSRIAELVDYTWLDERPLALTVFYFCDAPMQGDIDNIIKPIMDALVGIVYPNDRVIERVTAQKFEPDNERSFAEPSEMLATVLDMNAPVVYIRIEDDLAWRRN